MDWWKRSDARVRKNLHSDFVYFLCVCVWPNSLLDHGQTTDLYHMIDRILCLPFSCPATVIVMRRHRKTNARQDSFCPLAITDVRTNTEWWEQLLKNFQQARQAGGLGPASYLS